MRVSALRRKWLSCTWVAAVVATGIPTAAVMADTFGPVRYDPQSDQIIATVMYDGKNPNHHFTIRWGRCRKHLGQPAAAARLIINLGILDDQANDAARKPYVKTVKVPLSGMACRPATVTLWTPPKQYATVRIP